MTYRSDIRGLQETRTAVLATIAAAQAEGAHGEAVRYATLAADRYAVSITVVDTGSWRAAQHPEVRGLQGRICIDPAAVNPKSGGRPAIYGAALELERGGRYAVYARTVNEAGQRILTEAGTRLYRSLP
jgi:hypothetical protein